MNLPFGFSLEADFSGTVLYFLGLLCLTVLFTYFSNHHKGAGQLAKTSLLFILFARVASVILLLVLIFEPSVVLTHQFDTPQKVAIVVDQSRSMNAAWQGNPAELKAKIRSIISELEETHDVELWSLGGEPVQEGSIDFLENMSVFDWTPKLGDREAIKNLYNAVILISDGQLNGGRSPLDIPWTSVIPIYPIYPLVPISNTELKILESTYAVSEPTSNQIEVKISLQQEGLIGKTANIQIWTELDQLIGQSSLRLNQVFVEASVSVNLQTIESQTLKIVTFLENGDFHSENYLKIDFQDRIKRVLIVSERVNELHKFLKLSLADSLFQKDVVLGTALKPSDSFKLLSDEKFDLIVLNEAGPGVLTDQLGSIIATNRDVNCPIILFNTGLEPMNREWLKLLGIQESHKELVSGDASAYWNQAATDHAFYLGLMGQGFAPEKILEYPPLRAASYSHSADGAELMGTGVGKQYSTAMILGDSPPMAIFNGAGYWEWFFHPQSKDSFKIFWDYLLIYLNDIANFEPVTISLPVKTASTGNYIEVEVRVKDLDNRIIPAAELRVWQEHESGQKEPLNLTRKASGAYSAQVNTNFSGTAALIAEAFRFGELWGRDTSMLQLVSFNGEDQSKGVDQVFLARLANLSGGGIIQIPDNDLPKIPINYVSASTSFQLKGVRSPIIFGILVILLILEWTIRRRTGLL